MQIMRTIGVGDETEGRRLFRSSLMLLALLAIATVPLLAQVSPVTTADLPSLYGSAVAWGDFNNDGWLDFVLTGTRNIAYDGTGNDGKIYQNNGNGTFTPIASKIDSVSSGSVAWGDYDNDGYLDLLIAGRDSLYRVTKLFHNEQNGTFTEDTAAHITGAAFGSVTWVDFDNDGYLDVTITTARTPQLPLTLLFRNNHNGTFTEVTTAVFQGVNGHSKTAWADYDNDGYPDVVICGRTNTTNDTPDPMTLLYHNNRGDGTFTVDTAAHLPGVWRGSVAWGDYNNDGYPDLALNGAYTGMVGGLTRDTTRVFRNNNGNGTFTDIGQFFPENSQSSIAWIDYNNDGLLDLFQSGYGGAGIFRNNGNSTFTLVSSGLRPVAEGGISWGDFNNDGFADLITTGLDNFTGRDTTILYQNVVPGSNTSFTPNTAPEAPGTLNAQVAGNNVTFSWARATDGQTISKGLSYNIRVGMSPNGIETVSPLAIPASGFRKVAALGNTYADTAWTIKGLADGTYYWSVQAVDNAWTGSPFATEGTFTVGGVPALKPAVSVKVLLEGAVVSGDTMAGTLRTGGALVEHFGSRPIPYRAVDSIAVELRDSLSASSIREVAPAWLLQDGTILSFADTTKAFVEFNSVTAGRYYIAVHHRNHLAVISAARDSVAATASPTTYDFTSAEASAHGSSPMATLDGGKFAMYAGDVNHSGIITASDANVVFSVLNEAGYHAADVNLSGIVSSADANIIFKNLNKTTQVP